MAQQRDVLIFDYGDSPRASIEESLAGDMRRTLAVAHVLYESMRNAHGELLTEPEPEQEYGAQMWFRDGDRTLLHSVVVEPVASRPYTWAVVFRAYPGCLWPRRLNHGLVERVKDALHDAVRGDEFRNARWLTKQEFREIS
jgi:hypothetical protein